MNVLRSIVESIVTHAAQCWISEWFERRKEAREHKPDAAEKVEAPAPYRVPRDFESQGL